MFKFYWSLFRGIPEVLRGTTEAWVFWVQTFAIPFLLFLYPKWKHYVDGPTFSRWVILYPIIASIIYGMLRVNYVKFQKLSTQLKEAYAYETARRAFSAKRAALGTYRGEYLKLLAVCVQTATPTDDLIAQEKQLCLNCMDYVEQHFDAGEVSLLLASKVPTPDDIAKALLQTDQERAILYMHMGDMAAALGNLIQETRPSIVDTGAPQLRQV